jgi:hypothetical protein
MRLLSGGYIVELDVCGHWSRIALQAQRQFCTRRQRTGSECRSRIRTLAGSNAIIHLAMHDAFLKADPAAFKTVHPLLAETSTFHSALPPAPTKTCRAAALAGAAAHAIDVLFDTQTTVDAWPAFQDSLKRSGDPSDAIASGFAYGRCIAQLLLDDLQSKDKPVWRPVSLVEQTALDSTTDVSVNSQFDQECTEDGDGYPKDPAMLEACLRELEGIGRFWSGKFAGDWKAPPVIHRCTESILTICEQSLLPAAFQISLLALVHQGLAAVADKSDDQHAVLAAFKGKMTRRAAGQETAKHYRALARTGRWQGVPMPDAFADDGLLDDENEHSYDAHARTALWTVCFKLARILQDRLPFAFPRDRYDFALAVETGSAMEKDGFVEPAVIIRSVTLDEAQRESELAGALLGAVNNAEIATGRQLGTSIVNRLARIGRGPAVIIQGIT